MYAILVKDFFVGRNGYQIRLVRADGTVAASTGARNRTFTGGLADLPAVNSSLTKVYYIDGDSDVRYLTPAGGSGLAYQMPVTGNQIASFAVSPDDRRIAFTVIDYFSQANSSQSPVMHLFVDDLGGGHRVDLFTSSSVYEWPVGWHQGRLVLAVGRGAFVQNAGDWFMSGSSFHVVDATTADRLAVLCNDQPPATIPMPAGVVCGSSYLQGGVYKPQAYIQSWDASKRVIPQNNGACLQAGLLAPDGSRMATYSARATADGGCSHDYGATIRLISPDGTFIDTRVQGSPMGWLDNSKLLVQEDLPASSPPDAVAPIKVLDLASGAVQVVAASGFFAGNLPGGLG